MTDVKSPSAFESDEWRSGMPDGETTSVEETPDAGPGSRLYVPDFDELVAPVDLPRRRPPLPWVVGAVIAVIVVVAVVAGVIVVRPFSAVRAADYSAGTSQTSALQKKYVAASTAVDDALSFLYAQDGSYDADKAVALKQKAVALRKAVKAFGSERAMRDQNVADAYDAYSRQALHFVDLATNLADSAKPLSDALSVCNATPSATIYDDDFTSQYEQYISACGESVKTLNKAPAKVVTDLADTMASNLSSMTDIINQMKGIGNASSLSSGSSQLQQLQDLSSQLVDLDLSSGALTDFSDKLRQARDNADPTALLKKLNTVLKQGYEEKSKH
ncbi:hypothetical protein JS531_00520 [Bifidobacterium sp. CP2]|uniref:hypothetical protein n=1 Tax=Bifidobacterium sp. CP2 TaxID=2809025 RepID=UPI001BDC1A29|nr:hypothetical protein [Bifidobacterium sp. CP2]MBT1180484.1 hypothetical protein [Bifidobacterium sp. CP2]